MEIGHIKTKITQVRKHFVVRNLMNEPSGHLTEGISAVRFGQNELQNQKKSRNGKKKKQNKNPHSRGALEQILPSLQFVHSNKAVP